jgi:D-alanine-D-alanine ligase
MKKLKIGILFGGKSAEHEVSLQSAKSIYKAIDRDKYEPVLIAINKKGEWKMREDNDFFVNPDDPEKIRLNDDSDSVAIVPQSSGRIINSRDSEPRDKVDVLFPILHGTYGEDGTVQGMIKLIDVPFVGAGVLGSSVGMDKDVMKRLLNETGVLNAKCLIAKEDDFPIFDEAEKVLGLPMFIKPANLGSSVGISKVRNAKEYVKAIKKAFLYDTKILIEEFIDGREIECAVLGNDEVESSIPGEVVVKSDFYSYEAKYVDSTAFELKIPAEIPENLQGTIKDLACRTFKTLCCEGMGRVDIFLCKNDILYVNEINTIPGFTKNSMYPKLWEASGLSYKNLITKLIDLAIERHKKEKSLKTTFK